MRFEVGDLVKHIGFADQLGLVVSVEEHTSGEQLIRVLWRGTLHFLHLSSWLVKFETSEDT